MDNNYCGTLSSRNVKPVNDITLGTTLDIYRANYSALLRNKIDIYYIRELILQMKPNGVSKINHAESEAFK